MTDAQEPTDTELNWLVIRNDLDQTRIDRDYWKDMTERWKAQFDSASAAASEYSEFWENHSGDFDQFGNYIPHSQMDGDLRAARAEIERLHDISRIIGAIPQNVEVAIKRMQTLIDTALDGRAYEQECKAQMCNAIILLRYAYSSEDGHVTRADRATSFPSQISKAVGNAGD